MEKIFLCMAFLCIFANNDIIKIDDKFIKGKFYMKEYDNINTNKKILLNKMLDPSKFTTSYKIMWFYAIYKEMLSGHKKASIKKLSANMVSAAYYPIEHENLDFGKLDKLSDITFYLKNNLKIDTLENEDYICGYIMGSNDEKLNEMVIKLGKYVPYRLIRPFYDDFIKDKEYKICKKMPDAYINKYIQELNEEKDDIDVLYKINKNGDMIEFCESWIKYIMENKNSILYLIKYKLISYLETKNPNDNKIEFKLGRKLATDKNLSF